MKQLKRKRDEDADGENDDKPEPAGAGARENDDKLPTLTEAAGSVNLFFNENRGHEMSVKYNFDKFAVLIRKDAATDGELCASSVIDKYLQQMNLSSSVLERLRKEMKGCTVGVEVNFIQYTTSLGNALHAAAYTVDFNTQSL